MSFRAAADSMTRILTPAFWAKQVESAIVFTRKSEQSGQAIKPFFMMMTMVGLTGYSMEYLMVGQYHAAERQKVIKHALANHHH